MRIGQRRRAKTLSSFFSIQRSAMMRRKYPVDNNGTSSTSDGNIVLNGFIILVFIFLVVSCS